MNFIHIYRGDIGLNLQLSTFEVAIPCQQLVAL